MGTTRIFLTKTFLSTLFAALHAKACPNPDGKDILLVDKLGIRPSEKKLILDAASLRDFDEIIDFSWDLGEEQSYAPGLRKRLTRKYKEKALIKPIYTLLYHFLDSLKARKDRKKLAAKIGVPKGGGGQLDLYLLPHKQLTVVLKKLYPEASCTYIEHGLGDYYDIQKLTDEEMKFSCLFSESYQSFLHSTGEDRIETEKVFPPHTFEQQKEAFELLFPQLATITERLPQQNKLVLILIQPFEQQQIPLKFWDFFLDESLKRLPTTEGRYFLIKPHPKQARDVTQHVLGYFKKKGLNAGVWDSAELRSLSVEVIFSCLQDKVEYVFSPSSSSIFYLPVLFPDSKAQFYWSLRYVLRFADKTSPMFKDRWIQALPMFDAVFGAYARELEDERMRG